MAEPDAFGEEPAGHAAVTRMAWRRLERETTSTGTPHGAIVRTRRVTRRAAQVVVGPLDGVEARRAQPAATASNASSSHGFEADERRVVGRAGLDDQTVGLVVVTPVTAPPAVALSGHEPETSPKNGVSDCGSGTSMPT